LALAISANTADGFQNTETKAGMSAALKIVFLSGAVHRRARFFHPKNRIAKGRFTRFLRLPVVGFTL
jgi:hypothetical protein